MPGRFAPGPGRARRVPVPTPRGGGGDGGQVRWRCAARRWWQRRLSEPAGAQAPFAHWAGALGGGLWPGAVRPDGGEPAKRERRQPPGGAPDGGSSSAVKASSEATQRTRRSREPSAPWAGVLGGGPRPGISNPRRLRPTAGDTTQKARRRMAPGFCAARDPRAQAATNSWAITECLERFCGFERGVDFASHSE